jgi:short-subunit dehydrogenase
VPNHRNKKQKSYVVVYGAHNNGSRAFCKHLADKGYSLIIIDREESLLNSAEKHIVAEFPDISLMKVRMDEFDEVETLRVVKQVNKLGDVIRGLVLTKNIMLSEQNNKKFEELTYEELHQIMHNNNEMIVGLTNILLKPIKKAGRGFIVNLRNVKYDKVGDMIYWDLLYYSTSVFSSTFMGAIRQSEEKVKVIDVQVNYSTIKKEDEKERLCNKTFGYLGIVNSIKY